jgi:uncharacterized protein YndB with AHSA1/START domain
MERTIKHIWFLNHDPQEVWEHLTNSNLIAEWLMKNDFKPEVGHKFQFSTTARPGFDGNVYCQVLEVTPLQKLSYSWKGGPEKGKITLDSVVEWTLKPKNNGTELLLEHKGFKGLKNYMAYFFMNEGWRTKIRRKFAELLDQNVIKK